MKYINNIYYERAIDALNALGRSKEDLKEELMRDREEGLEIWTFYQEEDWETPVVAKHMNRHAARANIKSSMFYVDDLIKEWC